MKFKYVFVFLLLTSVVITSFLNSKLDGGYKCQTLESQNLKVQCWQKVLDKILRQKGLRAAFSFTKDLKEVDSNLDSTCHDFMHILGRLSYDEFKKHNEIEISEESTTCAYGFYHGFMETLISKGGTIESSRDFCKKVGELFNYQESDPGDCYHGIGHGASLMYEDEIKSADFTNIFTKSFKICEEAAIDESTLKSCIHGVVDGTGATLISFDSSGEDLQTPKQMLNLCSSVKNIYKETCYSGFAWYLLNYFEGDYEKSFREASKYVESKYLGAVVRTLSNDLFIFERNNLRESNVENVCNRLSDDLRLECVNGLIGGMVHFGKTDLSQELVSDYCLAMASNTNKDTCFKEAINIIASEYGDDDFYYFCNQIPTEYTKECAKFNK